MAGETILVIDSDTETAQKIVTILESEEYLVFTAASGDVAVTMAKKVTPALIYINPSMPDTSGLEISKTIHNMEEFKDVPVIALSSFGGALDPRYASLYGIIDSLKKPFKEADLISKTKNALSKKFDFKPFVEEDIELTKKEPIPAVTKPWMTKTRQEATEDIDFSDKTQVLKEGIDFSDKTQMLKKKVDVSDKTQMKLREETDIFDKTQVKPTVEQEISDKTLLKAFSPGESRDIKKERDRTYIMKENIRRKRMRSRIFLLIFLVIIIAMLGAGGYLLYNKGLLPWIKPKAPVAVKPTPPKTETVQQPDPTVPPTPEQPKPEVPVAPTKPAPPSAPTPPAPKPVVKPPQEKVTTPAKGIYSIQVGAFQNAGNAEAIAKKYKDKGYDAFTSKGTIKGKEVYRVFIGKFENRKDALKLDKDIRTKEKIKTIVYRN